MVYQDKTLTCVECGQPFTFSADDQSYHAQKGYTNEPKRCPTCRQARRSRTTSGPGGYEMGQRQMYTITCSNCGKNDEVPFLPRGDRPVFCRECYSTQPGRTTRSRGY